MPLVAVPAHFDGDQIRLDEPYKLEPNTRLIVTILPASPSEDEDESWLALSFQGLEGAYGEDEPEYSVELLKKANPDYV